MTLNHTYASAQRVGRKKQYVERITLPLSDEMLAAVDASLLDGEARVDLIRVAIEREVKKRGKAK